MPLGRYLPVCLIPHQQTHTAHRMAGFPAVPLPPHTLTGADMATISELAATANRFLVRDRERDMVLPTADAPEWLTDLCRDAHGTMFPDDWRYEFIQDALNALEDDEDAEPDVDSLYPYTADRLKWLASHLDRPGYCDAAVQDMGLTFTDTVTLIGWGMAAELSEVFELVRGFLETRCEDAEAE